MAMGDEWGMFFSLGRLFWAFLSLPRTIQAYASTNKKAVKYKEFHGLSLEPLFGFEPKTFRLQGGCSTAELKWRGIHLTKKT